MDVSTSAMAWDLGIPIRSRRLNLTSSLALCKSCKEFYRDLSMSNYKKNNPQFHQLPISEI